MRDKHDGGADRSTLLPKDRLALDEIELYAEILAAVASADRPLTQDEIDRVLGVPPATSRSDDAAGKPPRRTGAKPLTGKQMYRQVERHVAATNPPYDVDAGLRKLSVWMGSSLSGLRREPAAPDRRLTEEDIRLLGEFAQGATVDVAARRMGLSERTLRRRLRAICDRLGVNTPIEAVVWAVRQGHIEESGDSPPPGSAATGMEAASSPAVGPEDGTRRAVVTVTEDDLDDLEFDTLRTGDHAAAASQLADLAQTDSVGVSRAKILLRAGEQWQHAGDHAKATELYQSAIDDGGEAYGDPRAYLADALFELGRADEASALIEQIRADAPQDPEVYQTVAEILYAHGNLQGAHNWSTAGVDVIIAAQVNTAADSLEALLRIRYRTRLGLGQPEDKYDALLNERLLREEAHLRPERTRDGDDTGVAR